MSGEIALTVPESTDIVYKGPTAEQMARLKASVARVRDLILAKQADAGPDVVGGLFDAYGEAKWAPFRDPAYDYSRWGDWEVWQFQREAEQGASLVPQKSWVVWNAETKQLFGFEPGKADNARYKAEVFAVHLNEGKPTRVVPAAGGFAMASVSYAEAHALVTEADRRLTPQEGSDG